MIIFTSGCLLFAWLFAWLNQCHIELKLICFSHTDIYVNTALYYVVTASVIAVIGGEDLSQNDPGTKTHLILSITHVTGIKTRKDVAPELGENTNVWTDGVCYVASSYIFLVLRMHELAQRTCVWHLDDKIWNAITSWYLQPDILKFEPGVITNQPDNKHLPSGIPSWRSTLRLTS